MTGRDDRPLLDGILDAVDSALLLVASDGAVVLLNSAAEELLGLPASDVVGRRLQTCFQFEDANGPVVEERLPWIRALANAEDAAATMSFTAPDSRSVDVRVHVRPVSGDASLGAIVTLQEEYATVVQLLRDELAHSTLLQEVAVVSTSSPDLRVACTRVLKALARHLGLAAGDIRVASADGETLRLVASHGYPEEMARLIEDTLSQDGKTMAQLSFRSKRVITHEDEAISAEHRALMATGSHGEKRFVTMPVEYRKRVVGVLSLVFPERRSFTEEELSLFHAVSHTLGQTIETARLLDAEKEARQRSTAELEISNLLLDAAERLARPIELRESCETLAEILAKVTGRSRVVVSLYQERQQRMVVRAARGVACTDVGTSVTFDRIPAPFLEMMTDGRARIVTPDSPLMTEEQRERAKSNGSQRSLMVPLVSHERFLGIVTADEPGDGRPFTQREVRLAEAVASQAATLIENARVYESEHRIAETLQETLLLMPDRVPGVRFGTLYRSATAAARVGGDFYDLFEIAPGRVALVVGDVSGKGLDAASVTALARNAFRIHASEGVPPGVVVQRTSEALWRFTSAETFATAFFGVLETRTGALTYVSAGHPEGMIVGQGGYVRRLGGESPLLGALEDARFAEEVTVLARSDVVFAYTDGVTEARQGRELYGVERLGEFLEGLRDNDPVTLPQKVFAAIEAFSDGRLRDDVAMLAVRRDVDEETE